MTDASLNYETFDLAEALASRTYEEDTIKILLDDSVNRDIAKVRKEVEEALRSGDSDAEAAGNERIKELLAERESKLFTVHLKDVEEHVKNALSRKLIAEHPIQYDAFGRVIPDEEGDEAATIAQWALFLVKIVDPQGREVPIFQESAAMLFNNAPTLAKRQINEALDELQKAPAEGHRVAMQEQAFLSTASHEG